MIKITFIESSGEKMIVETECEGTLMETAISNLAPGIIAECGGSCVCATCHVLVSPEWVNKLPPIAAEEAETVAGAVTYQKNSRLACQIELNESMDGLVVHTPADQF